MELDNMAMSREEKVEFLGYLEGVKANNMEENNSSQRAFIVNGENLFYENELDWIIANLRRELQ